MLVPRPGEPHPELDIFDRRPLEALIEPADTVERRAPYRADPRPERLRRTRALVVDMVVEQVAEPRDEPRRCGRVVVRPEDACEVRATLRARAGSARARHGGRDVGIDEDDMSPAERATPAFLARPALAPAKSSTTTSSSGGSSLAASAARHTPASAARSSRGRRRRAEGERKSDGRAAAETPVERRSAASRGREARGYPPSLNAVIGVICNRSARAARLVRARGRNVGWGVLGRHMS